MKFLVDAHLPRKLAIQLKDMGTTLAIRSAYRLAIAPRISSCVVKGFAIH